MHCLVGTSSVARSLLASLRQKRCSGPSCCIAWQHRQGAFAGPGGHADSAGPGPLTGLLILSHIDLACMHADLHNPA